MQCINIHLTGCLREKIGKGLTLRSKNVIINLQDLIKMSSGDLTTKYFYLTLPGAGGGLKHPPDKF